MSVQPPEIVAAASLSPLSPSPIPLHNTSSALVPKLQEPAAALDVSHASFSPPCAEPDTTIAMDSRSDAAEPSDTIVVAGDYSDDDSQEESDFDAYGEDEEEQEQEQNEPDSVNDDYAKTFDSPTEQEHQSEAGEAQPDVSKAAESMNSSSAPDTLKSQSPPAPTSVLSSPPPSRGAVFNGSAQGSSAPSEHASTDSFSAAPSAASKSSASPPIAPAAPASEVLTDAIAPSVAVAVVSTAVSTPASTDEDDKSINIQKLVDDITARAAATAAPPLTSAQATPVTSSQNVSTTLTLSPSASLPPKPSVSHHAPSHLPAIPQAHSFQSRNHNSLSSPVTSLPSASSNTQRSSYLSVGAPGTANEAFSSLPPPPQTSLGAPHDHRLASPSTAHHIPPQSPAAHQAWETFLVDEKRYTSEAKWERFPEGSRIFIGNLSSERVSKHEVFDVFSRFGRLAQISLKNAYGFVQYHTIAEGQAAMQGAQGIEMGGRKIHLEISRAQKKKDKDERDRSPERRTQRGERGARPNERYENRDSGWRRDDYRPRRSPSPQRNDARGSRDGFGPRDRDFGAFERRRSRSPPRYSRSGPESYRTRSPSPHRHAPSDAGLDLPRRYGSDVPDVQFVLLQEVSRDFVSWVQRAFHDRGLKTDVMFLNPRFPRDALVQRQVLEGVHGIIELDFAAQAQGKISIQVFSRPANSNVRFELYQNIDPPIAAELVLREKSKSAPPAPAYPPNNYGHASYPSETAPAPAPAAGYGYSYSHPSAPPAQPQPAAPAPDLASMVGQLDNSALQALLASLQTPQGAAAQQPGIQIGMQPAAGAQAPQIDINALLGNLRNAAPTQSALVPGYGGVANYGAPASYLPHGAAVISPTNAATGMGYGSSDTAQQVQTIMDQLKRATQ